jgi:hypothetical protein
MPSCKICGAEIVGRRIVVNGPKPTLYCSRACNTKAANIHRANRAEPKRKECPVCLGMFKAGHGQLYCCRACSLMAEAIREFARHHSIHNRQSSQQEFPPRELLLVRATNVRLRRGTDDQFNYQEHRRGRGGIGSGADAEVADKCDEHPHVEDELCNADAAA